MSLTGALLAVFIQQWARSYLQATQERHSPHKRARIRAFHAEGLEKFSLHRVTRAMPILIHVSLFLFFSGLPIFLFNVNRTVFNVVVAWLALCVAGYACITLMPVIYQNSPYYSPISSSIWWCVTNALFILYQFFKFFIPRNSFVLRWYRAHYANSQFRWPSLRAMQKASGRFARKLSSDIDYRALRRMFKTLNEDDEFEHFFDALPSLCESKRLNDAQTAFIKRNKTKLSRALIGMMDRTLLSELVSEEVKQRRIIICTKVIGATSLLESRWTLPHVLFGDWKGFSKSIHFGLFVQDWKDISDPVTAFYAQFVVAVTLASVQERDDRWFELASGQLKESKSFLRNCYLVGDSILLTNAIFIIRRMIQTFCGSGHHRQRDIYILEASLKTLELVCRFDIQNTLEEHQHVFCSLWNQLVDAAQDNIDPHITSICVMILKSIRRLYVTLHGKTAAAVAAGSYGGAAVLGQARTYPRCNSEEHYPSNMVPGLPLHGLQIDAHHVSMDVIRDLTSMLVPVLPPTYTTPYPAVVPNPYYTVAFGPSSSAIPSYYPPNTQSMYYPIHPRSYDPLAPGPYPFVPDSYSYSTAPVPTNTFVSIPQMASSPTRPTRRRGRRRRRRDAPATTNEANLRLEGHEFHAPSHFTPEIPHRRRVGFVGVSSSGSSSPAVPARQEWPAIRSDANISISTPAPTTRTPFVPPLSSLGQFYVPQGPPVGLPDISQRLQVTPDTDSLHSTTDASFATARSASSSPVPSPRRFTGASREGSLAQTPSAMPPVIEVNGYGEFSGLLHYSLHSVLYEGKLYPTALHLFEARKFLPQRPDLAKRIRQCERVDQVASISAELANFVRKDWGNIMLSMVGSNVFPYSTPRLGICLLTDRSIADGRIDGRGVVPQVPPAQWPTRVAFQHVPFRTCLS